MLTELTTLSMLHLTFYLTLYLSPFIITIYRLPAKYVNHPYFLVALNDINACRTRVKEAPNPIFDEEYTLDDLPGKRQRRAGDRLIGFLNG